MEKRAIARSNGCVLDTRENFSMIYVKCDLKLRTPLGSDYIIFVAKLKNRSKLGVRVRIAISRVTILICRVTHEQCSACTKSRMGYE